ncbi:MAG TPA: hypothetical protein VE127_02925 [Solirubrobacteraceae bacterium]|jgi:hypothetical protein|nr:hypothetical protein [Solirubrobacteraceae bacterium]
MGIPAAILEGGLVMLPHAAPFERLTRLRSPLWTAMLPGSIIIGTFGVVALPGTAPTTLLIAAITTPLLALLAVTSVVRARWLVLVAGAVAAGLAGFATGLPGQLGSAAITALACLTIGATLQRLIPSRWLLAGVVAMAVVDSVLLASGIGYHQTVVLAAAARSFPGPHFTGARVGGTTIGYPDLFLAALLGTSLAGRRAQWAGGLLLAVLVVAYDSLLSPGVLLPATVPIAITMIAILAARSLGRLRSRQRLGSRHRGARTKHRPGDPRPACPAPG